MLYNCIFCLFSFFTRSVQYSPVGSQKSSFISEKERKEIEDYLDDFYEYCVTYADKLTDKYRVPFLPSNDTAKEEIDEYVCICKEKFIEIDEEGIEKTI